MAAIGTAAGVRGPKEVDGPATFVKTARENAILHVTAEPLDKEGYCVVSHAYVDKLVGQAKLAAVLMVRASHPHQRMHCPQPTWGRARQQCRGAYS